MWVPPAQRGFGLAFRHRNRLHTCPTLRTLPVCCSWCQPICSIQRCLFHSLPCLKSVAKTKAVEEEEHFCVLGVDGIPALPALRGRIHWCRCEVRWCWRWYGFSRSSVSKYWAWYGAPDCPSSAFVGELVVLLVGVVAVTAWSLARHGQLMGALPLGVPPGDCMGDFFSQKVAPTVTVIIVTSDTVVLLIVRLTVWWVSFGWWPPVASSNCKVPMYA